MPTLTSLLARDAIVSLDVVEQALQRQVLEGGEIDTALLELAAVPENVLASYRAASFDLRPAARAQLEAVPKDVLARVPKEVAQEFRVIPIAQQREVLVLAADAPLQALEIQRLMSSLGVRVAFRIVTELRAFAALHEYYGAELPTRFHALAERLKDTSPGDLCEVRQSTPSREPIAFRNRASVRPPDSSTGLRMPREGGIIEAVRNVSVSLPPPRSASAGSLAAAALPREAQHDLNEARSSSSTSTAKAPTHRPSVQALPRGPITWQQAVQYIEEARDRDRLFDVFFGFARQYFDCTVLFVVRDERLLPFRSSGLAAAPDEEGVSLRQLTGGAIMATAQTIAARIADLRGHSSDAALLGAIGRARCQPCALVPIAIRKRLIGLLYADRAGEPFELGDFPEVLPLVTTLSAAFERLIRERKRSAAEAIEAADGHEPVTAERSLPRALTRAAAAMARVRTLPDMVPPPDPGISIASPSAATQDEAERAESAPVLAEPASGRSALLTQPELPEPGLVLGDGEPLAAAAEPDAAPELRVSSSATPSAAFDTAAQENGAGTKDIALDAANATQSSSLEAARVEQALARDAASDSAAVAAEQDHVPPSGLRALTGTAPGYPAPARAPISRPMSRGGTYSERGGSEEHIRTDRSELTKTLPQRPMRRADSQQLGRISLVPPPRTLSHVPKGAGSYSLRPLSGSATHTEPTLREPSRAESIGRGSAASEDGLEDSDQAALAPTDPPPGGRSAQMAAAPPAPRVPEPDTSPEVSRAEALPSIVVTSPDAEADRIVEDLLKTTPENCGEPIAALVRLGNDGLAALQKRFPGPLWFDRTTPRHSLPSGDEISAIATGLRAFEDKAAAAIGELLGSAQVDARFCALLLAAERPRAPLLWPLYQRLFDSDGQIRVMALEVFPRFRGVQEFSEALRLLRDRAGDEREALPGRLSALEAIGTLRDSASVELLLKLCRHASRQLSIPAHRSLLLITAQDFGDSERKWRAWLDKNRRRPRVEWLIESLMHADERVRTTAGLELQKLTQVYYGFVASSSKRDRERAQQRYREWLLQQGKIPTLA